MLKAMAISFLAKEPEREEDFELLLGHYTHVFATVHATAQHIDLEPLASHYLETPPLDHI